MLHFPAATLSVKCLTGAGLEVALSEDGRDGGVVVQAVVVIRAKGR